MSSPIDEQNPSRALSSTRCSIVKARILIELNAGCYWLLCLLLDPKVVSIVGVFSFMDHQKIKEPRQPAGAFLTTDLGFGESESEDEATCAHILWVVSIVRSDLLRWGRMSCT